MSTPPWFCTHVCTWSASPGALVGRLVDLTPAVHGALERKEQRAQRLVIWGALEDLAHGERAPLPEPLTLQRRRDTGAQCADGADAVTARSKAVGLREVVGRRPWSSGQHVHRLAEASSRRPEEDED